MKKQKLIKGIVLLTMVLLMISISANVFAFGGGTIINPSDIQANGSMASSRIQSIAGTLLGIAQVIGVAVAVIMLIVLAIKYISASPEGKAEIKKSAVVYIVGAILLFGGVGLLNIIQSFSNNIDSGLMM